MVHLRFGLLVNWIATAVAACSFGCSGPSAGGGDPTGGGGEDGGGGAEPAYHGSVQGRAVDPDGDAIADLAVSLCFDVCLVTYTDASGKFLFEGVRPATHVLENLSHPGGDQAAAALEWIRFFDFVSVGVDEVVVLERPYVVHRVGDHQGPLGGLQDLSLVGKLQVAFDADLFDTDENPLPAPAAALHFGAVEIPVGDWPSGGLAGWTILRAWGAVVWDLHHDDAFSVTAPLGDAGPLPQDATVGFLIADYTYGFINGKFFEEAGELTMDGGSIRTPVGAGLDRATLWLAVTR